MLMMLPSCLVKCVLTWAVGFATPGFFLGGAMCAEIYPADAHDALVKCAQSLGQLVFQRLASRGAMGLEIYPADARDAALLPRQLRAIT